MWPGWVVCGVHVVCLYVCVRARSHVRAWVGARARMHARACVFSSTYETQKIVYRVRNRILFSLSLLKPFRRHFS